jgi:hypothetical protein
LHACSADAGLPSNPGSLFGWLRRLAVNSSGWAPKLEFVPEGKVERTWRRRDVDPQVAHSRP